jgi:hypothetical protein
MEFTNTAPWPEDIENCNLCNGERSIEIAVAGSIRIEICKCATQAVALRRVEEAGIPKRFYDWDLRHLQKGFRLKNKESLYLVKRYINNISKNIKNGKGLWVSAPPGLGKNQLLCYILRLALERNYKAYYIKAQHIPSLRIDSWKDKEAKNIFYRLTESSNIVAVSDLDKGPVSLDLNSFRVQQFYDVVSSIDDCKISLLVSSNVTKIEMLKRMPMFMQARFRPLKEVVLRYSHHKNGGLTNGQDVLNTD